MEDTALEKEKTSKELFKLQKTNNKYKQNEIKLNLENEDIKKQLTDYILENRDLSNHLIEKTKD